MNNLLLPRVVHYTQGGARLLPPGHNHVQWCANERQWRDGLACISHWGFDATEAAFASGLGCRLGGSGREYGEHYVGHHDLLGINTEIPNREVAHHEASHLLLVFILDGDSC